MKIFPNGFSSWQETHYEVVQAISEEYLKDEPKGLVLECQEAKGHGGLYELAEELTDEFEKLHIGREWDGDFFEVISKFLIGKLYV